MNENVELYHGDCLDIMPSLSDKSIDLILCDPPFNTTHCKWDTFIPFEQLWEQYKRLIKDKGVICLFASQPFTSSLICSNKEMYKYNWYWQKPAPANFLNMQCQPGKIIEDICVFSKSVAAPTSKNKMNYYPILSEGKPYKCTNNVANRLSSAFDENLNNHTTINQGNRLPNNLLKFNKPKTKYHPTQKPTALLEYIIKSYTEKGGLVLDNCMGSGSTGVACINTNRRFIGIEKEEIYFDVAKNRIQVGKDKEECRFSLSNMSYHNQPKTTTQASFDFSELSDGK